jgi:Ser/Thr protein kinase RdoA (MazF antagonist)
MAVFTDITTPRYQKQFSEIEKAYGITVTSIEGIPLGSSDSMFKITTREFDAPLVLTIHETPDVTPAGLTNEAAQIMIQYLGFLADATAEVTDRKGVPVEIVVLKPLSAHPNTEEQAPFLELIFDSVKKPASIVPFVEGRSYVNSPEEYIQPEDAYLAGRALAAFLSVAGSYPTPDRFPVYDFEQFAREVVGMADDEEGWEHLGYVLSNRRFEEEEAAKIGRRYISELKASGQRLVDEWQRLSRQEPAFPVTLIHGDLFADNVLIDEKSRLILLDFSEVSRCPIGIDLGTALLSWASQNGELLLHNMVRLLQGFDSVIALTGEQLSQLPIFIQFAAFRWETFRIQRIYLQDPRRRDIRSPAEFHSLRHAWQELQSLFTELVSVDDLPTRLDLRGRNSFL